MCQVRDWWDTLPDPNVPVASSQNAANPSALPGSDYFAQNVENSGYGVFVEPIAKIFERNGFPKERAFNNAKTIIQYAKDNINDKNHSPLDFNEKILERINTRRKQLDPDSEEIKETGLERELYEMQKAAYEKDKALYDGIIKRLKMGVKDLPEYRNVKRDPGIPYLSGAGWDTDEGFVKGLTNFTNKKGTQSGAMGISLSRDYYAAQFSYLKDWKSQLDDMEEQLNESKKNKRQKESAQDRFARRWVLPMNQKRSQKAR